MAFIQLAPDLITWQVAAVEF